MKRRDKRKSKQQRIQCQEQKLSLTKSGILLQARLRCVAMTVLDCLTKSWLDTGRSMPLTVSEVIHKYCICVLENKRNASLSTTTSTFRAMMTQAFRLHLLLDPGHEENTRCLARLIGFTFLL